jgi:ketosteroid isomerase-like protein
MTTKETVQRYFDCLQRKAEWQSFLAADMVFTSNTIPVKRVNGRDAYLQATKRFYSTIVTMEVRDLIVEGEMACALTHYQLQPPTGGPAFESEVAEIFSVANGKIESLAIYFDSAPFPK